MCSLFAEILLELHDDTLENYMKIFERLYDISITILDERVDNPTRRWIKCICDRMSVTLNQQIINCQKSISINNTNWILTIELQTYYEELKELLHDLQMLSLYV